MIGTGNEMTNDGTLTYTYDNKGSMIEQSKGLSGTALYYSYNDINQMVGSREILRGHREILRCEF
jgi:hypothetical protein